MVASDLPVLMPILTERIWVVEGHVKSRAHREAAGAAAEKEKRRRRSPRNVRRDRALWRLRPSAAESVRASAASTVTQARQMMGRRPNQQQVRAVWSVSRLPSR